MGFFDGSFMLVKNIVVKKCSGILRRCLMGFGKCRFEDFKAHLTRYFFGYDILVLVTLNFSLLEGRLDAIGFCLNVKTARGFNFCILFAAISPTKMGMQPSTTWQNMGIFLEKRWMLGISKILPFQWIVGVTLRLDPPPSDGGSPIVRYAIYHNDGTVNGLLSTQVLVCDMSRTEFAVPNLISGLDYQIQIQAHADCPTGTGTSLHAYDGQGLCVNDAECTLPGERSGVALYTTTDVPDLVVLAKVSGSQTRTAVTFRWDAPGNDGGSPITSYEPYRDDGLGGDFVRVDVLPTNYFEPDTELSVTGRVSKLLHQLVSIDCKSV